MQIPRGPKHLKCPLWKKAMSTCCHICPMWKQLRFVDPQTGKDIDDEWNCALAHMPGLLTENSLRSVQTAAAVAVAAEAIDQSGRQMAKEIHLMHGTVKQANVINTTILSALPLLDEVARIQTGRGLLITAEKGDGNGGHS